MKKTICVVTLALALSALMGCHGGKSPSGTKSTPAAGTSRVAQIDNGKKLHKSKGCAECHSTDGSAVEASSFQGLYSRKEVVPVEGFGDGCAVPVELTASEATAVIAFIQSLAKE